MAIGSLAGGEQSAMQPPSRLQLAKSPPPPSGVGNEPSVPASWAPPDEEPEDEPDDEPAPEDDPEDAPEDDPEIDPELEPDEDPELDPDPDPELEPDMPASPSPKEPFPLSSAHAPSATRAASIGDAAVSHRIMTGASWSDYGPW